MSAELVEGAGAPAMSATREGAEAAPKPRHPVRELLGRYGAVFRAAWERREELAGPRRMADERAFLPAALELQETPPHPAPRRAAIAICTLFVLALLWALIGQIDVVAVAQGRVIVSDRSKTIQPLETSVVREVFVKDGDKVKAGQLLIALDSTMTEADSHRVDKERVAALSEVLRSRALLQALTGGGAPQLTEASMSSMPREDANSARFQLQSEWADISAKLAKLQAELERRDAEIATAKQVVEKLQSTVPMAQQRERDYKALSDQGFVAGHAGQDRTRERIEQEKDLGTAIARERETQAALAESRGSTASFRAETLRTLRDREAQADLKLKQLAEEGAKANKRNQLTRLTAPVDGTVQQLAVHTAGGVVTEAQVLLVLVPDEAEVTAEVVLENKDIGFVRAGQEAEIKLETFPYTRYGTVAATVKSVSADAVNDEKRGAIFPVTLVLGKGVIDVDGKQVRLAPGMNVTAEIKTSQRRVIRYLFDPVKQHVDESMRER
ncbi:HlyD family type I secretion periplasmic adaptor subunit [Mitsuaria sp. CC2]|uniref:HlyD family type I secretion periplasmic adaptor subunit n=1 Tax=Mitsuaria sp. CC2 TaxID=3029186 RepID=UPI003B8B8320